MLTTSTEEEKKVAAGLLGKLYISPISSDEKIRELYAEVSEAVEEGIVSDATSRNSLYKIHVSLGKIVNSLDEQVPAQRRTSRSVSVLTDRHPAEDKTVMEESRIKEEEEDSEGTIVPKEEDKESLVDELLSDDEDTKIQDV